jgi:peptide/nickel transport system substrate-binding protein
MKKLCLFLVLLLLVALPMTAYNSEKSVLRIGIITQPDSTSPFIDTLAAFDIINNSVYNDLIEYDDSLYPVGGLAKDWSVSEDGLVWTFNLREGIKWSDGEDFNADDVVWTYTALIEGEYPQSVQLTGITKCEKVDEYTVKLYTENPKADMESMRVGMVPEHIYGDKSLEDLHTFAEDSPVGTGPFKLVEWEDGQFLKFEVNENYFKGAPHIDGIVYVVFANVDTLMLALIKGEVDATTSVSSTQVERLEQNPDVEVVKALGRNFQELGFNCWDSPESKGNPLILNPKIRLACDYAMNKEEIVEIALNGLGTPGTSLIPPSVGDWHWYPGDEKHNYGPEKAKQILEEAGYIDTDGDGIREDGEGNKLDFRFAVISSYGEAYVKASLIIQKNLQDIGINTNITTMDGGAQSDLIYKQNFDTDMYIWGWGAEFDPALKLSVLLTEQIGKRSDCFWSNEDYDELYKIQVNQVDREERLKTVHEMQRIVYEEAPYIILYYPDAVEAYRTDKFEGWTRVPEGIGNVISQVNKSTFLSIRSK